MPHGPEQRVCYCHAGCSACEFGEPCPHGVRPRTRKGGARQPGLRATYDAKLDEAFAGRVFDIVDEVHLPPGQCFVTQFGNKGRHGYIIQDRATGERLVVGATVLRQIHERYLGVSLPRRRPRIVPVPD